MPLNRVSLRKVSRAIVLKQLVSSVTRPDMHSCYMEVPRWRTLSSLKLKSFTGSGISFASCKDLSATWSYCIKFKAKRGLHGSLPAVSFLALFLSPR